MAKKWCYLVSYELPGIPNKGDLLGCMEIFLDSEWSPGDAAKIQDHMKEHHDIPKRPIITSVFSMGKH